MTNLPTSCSFAFRVAYDVIKHGTNILTLARDSPPLPARDASNALHRDAPEHPIHTRVKNLLPPPSPMHSLRQHRGPTYIRLDLGS
jgi:hypothetical protein